MDKRKCTEQLYDKIQMAILCFDSSTRLGVGAYKRLSWFCRKIEWVLFDGGSSLYHKLSDGNKTPRLKSVPHRLNPEKKKLADDFF